MILLEADNSRDQSYGQNDSLDVDDSSVNDSGSMNEDRWYGADKGSSDEDKAMFIASRRGQAETVRLLLSQGISATSRNEQGVHPLQLAARDGHVQTVQALLQFAPWAVELSDCYGIIALDEAIDIGSLDTVAVLMSKGTFSNLYTLSERLVYAFELN
ncbi:hypothetical protein XA68_11472 [Ophiocordyceps unilateralis]|uniref:Uncharacterized protein n=1 Tax=Ophiocordyceps unilateralis TaxID=268505 RepID=A0A2A9PFT9_OPHUN|nr:hypothetical protein XA68_11472 [Ophiocordyceps unilateralis]